MTRAGFVLAVMLLSAVAPCAAGACISTPEQKAEKFAAADKDGDGVLSLREYSAQSTLGGISAEQERALFDTADTDDSGGLSPAEFFAQLPQQRC